LNTAREQAKSPGIEDVMSKTGVDKEESLSPTDTWPLERLKTLHLEMGQQCNVRCAMCYQTDFRPSTKMSDLIWKERLWPAYAVAQTLVLSGGEPTVLRNCRELVEIATKQFPHLRLDTVTNGILFTEFWQEIFLQQGAYVNFSINAIDPAIYRALVKYGSQEKVIANIDRMVQRKRESQSGCVLRISSVILDQTIDELPAFVQWAVDHGLDQALTFTDHFRKLQQDPSRVQERIAETYAIADRNPQLKLISLDDFDWFFAQQHGIHPVRPRKLFTVEPKPCPIAFDTLYVNSDGWCKPCCKSWYLYGNLRRSSLMAVWSGSRAARFRQRMGDLDFRDCLVACDLNARPIHPTVSTMRKAYWVARRDPRAAVNKGMRKLGITNAQIGKTKPK
jgi:MoaA/NifB/PqqE/SkfB family radical SAM enzyme